MKQRLILILLVVCSVALAQSASKKPSTTHKAGAQKTVRAVEDHKVWAPDQLAWAPAPSILPTGAELAVLEGNPTKSGEFTMRLKMPDGYKIPPHFHPRTEHVTLISGSFLVGMGDTFDESKLGELPVGTFAWIKPGTHHFAMAKGETVIQLHGNGPWSLTYVNPTDDPRKKK
jgi:quercetin dioxygenase-like cupin family protein